MDFATIFATTCLVFVIQQGLQFVWCKLFHRKENKRK